MSINTFFYLIMLPISILSLLVGLVLPVLIVLSALIEGLKER